MLLADGQWHQITRFADHTSQEAFGPDGTLYLLSRKDAPWARCWRSTPPAFSVANAKTLVTRDAFVDRWFRAGGIAFLCALHGGRTVEAVR